MLFLVVDNRTRRLSGFVLYAQPSQASCFHVRPGAHLLWPRHNRIAPWGGAWRASLPAQGLLGDVVQPPGLRARLRPDPFGWAFWVGGAGVSGSLRGTKAGEGPVAASMPKISRPREVSPPVLLAEGNENSRRSPDRAKVEGENRRSGSRGV